MKMVYIIPVILFLGAFFFMFYINKKHKKVSNSVDLNLERRRYQEYFNDFLTSKYHFLNDWMGDQPIDAFTTVSVPRSTFEKLKQFALTSILKTTLKSLSVNYITDIPNCYIVLSNFDLHLLITDEEGDLCEHYILDNERLKNAVIEKKGKLKEQVGASSKESIEYLPTVYQLTVSLDNQYLSINIHDRLRYAPNTSNFIDVEKTYMERLKHRVVGEMLVTKLRIKYTNLN